MRVKFKTILWLSSSFIIVSLLSPLIFGKVFVYDDLLSYAFPLRVFYSYCLKHSQEFIWLPSIFNGYYVHGEGQVGMLHPLHLILYRFLPVNVAFQLELVLPYVAIFWGAKIWFQKRLDDLSSLFGAFCFMTSSFCALRMVHPNALQVVAHYPWLLIALDKILLTNDPIKKFKGFLCWALLLGSMILFGYPQYVLISLFLQIIYLVASYPISTLIESWRGFLFGGILGLGLGAAQLLPTIEYFNNSERVNFGIDFVGVGSLNPIEFFQTLGPYIYRGLCLFSESFASGTHEFGLYEGFFPVFALLWLFVERPKDPTKKRMIKLGVLFLILGIFLSLGRYNGLFYLYGQLKPFSLFRYHSRHRVLISFGTAILSAVGMSEILGSSSSQRKNRVYLLPGIFSLLIAVIAIAIKKSRPDLMHQFFLNTTILIAPAVFLVIGVVFYLGLIKKRWVLLTVLLLAVVDRGVYQLSYAFHDAPLGINWSSYGKLKSNRKLYLSNSTLIEGERLIDGYLGVAPQRLLDYSSKKAQQAAAVDNTEKYPRYWMVTRIVPSNNPAREIELIDLSTTALTEQNLDLVAGEKGEVRVLDESPGKFVFSTSANSRQLLVVSESFNPGWKATLDGASERVLRVNGDFMGVTVPPGEHSVRLNFRPWSYFWGLWITGISLCLVSLGFVLSQKRPKIFAQSKAVPLGG